MSTPKVTAATFKAFVRKNAAALHVAVESSFDGMTDGTVSRGGQFKPATASTIDAPSHTLGFSGVWLVGHSRDYFQAFEKDGFRGISVCNSCGSFKVAVKMD